jgi:hypothetical protein
MHAPVAVQFHGTMPFRERHREREFLRRMLYCLLVHIELASKKNQQQNKYIHEHANQNQLAIRINQEKKLNFDGV